MVKEKQFLLNMIMAKIAEDVKELNSLTLKSSMVISDQKDIMLEVHFIDGSEDNFTEELYILIASALYPFKNISSMVTVTCSENEEDLDATLTVKFIS